MSLTSSQRQFGNTSQTAARMVYISTICHHKSSCTGIATYESTKTTQKTKRPAILLSPSSLFMFPLAPIKRASSHQETFWTLAYAFRVALIHWEQPRSTRSIRHFWSQPILEGIRLLRYPVNQFANVDVMLTILKPAHLQSHNNNNNIYSF